MKVTPFKKKFGKHLPGEVFELPDKSAALLIRARILLAAEPESAARPKRQYRRRDIQAET